MPQPKQVSRKLDNSMDRPKPKPAVNREKPNTISGSDWTGINPKKREPIDPRMPKLQPP